MGDVSGSTFLSIILGLPIIIGITVLSIPFIIVAAITGISLDIVVKSILVFGIAVFIVWIFGRYQIIENGIVGLIAVTLVYKHFSCHPVACILIGATIVGLLFLVTYLKIGLIIKTVIFSLIVTFFAYAIFYSDSGLLPAPDNVWRVTFCIIFFLENLYIRFCPQE